MKNNELIKRELIVEKAELDLKFYKLDKFIDTKDFDTLPELQKKAINEQWMAMNSFSKALQKRLELL